MMHEEERALVSIIIPVYNHEAYLQDCLASIIAQDYDPIELIMIDDCSTDSSYQVMSAWEDRLKRRFGRVILLRNETNCGITRNLNRMLALTEGTYVKALASDDFLLPGAIGALVDFLERHLNCGLVYADAVWGDAHTHFPIAQTEEEARREEVKDAFEALYRKDFIMAPTVLLRRDVLDRVGWFDEDLKIEDWDMYLRVAATYEIGYMGQKVVMYRNIETSLSHSTELSRRKMMCMSELQILIKHRERAGKIAPALIFDKANAVFLEAFHMRSRDYLETVAAFMQRYCIKRSVKNRLLYVLYRLHVLDIIMH